MVRAQHLYNIAGAARLGSLDGDLLDCTNQNICTAPRRRMRSHGARQKRIEMRRIL